MNVIAGMSGGVDSSVAALLLSHDAYVTSLQGLFMHNWEEDADGPCRADADRKDALAVCAVLGMRFHTRNFSAEYWDGVFAHFIAEYRVGRTPNPDVLCNREIKFKTFLDQARALGADKIATGHYARIGQHAGRWQLLRGRDRNKDQSYFLHALGQEQLSATLFPLGELEKPHVRAMAQERGLPTHGKKDSTGICFIGERDFRAFLSRYISAQPGEMRTPQGTLLGTHDGVMYYTLGQRNGLAIGGRRGASNAPWYVVGKDVADNILYVAQGGENRWLQSRRLRASQATWVDGTFPAAEFSCTAKTRYRQPDQACRVRVDGGNLDIHFELPQRAVTPGQSVVLYQDEVCLGGAIIDATDAAFGGMETAWNL